MKVFVLLILMALPCIVFSQTQDSIFQYCQVKIIGKPLSTKITIEVDYGQEYKVFNKSSVVKDTDGSIRTFNSIAHALNFMGTMGWRVIQSYATGFDSATSDHFFLLETRKKLPQ